MGQVYASVYYHLIWATKGRAPLILPEIEILVWDRIRRACGEVKVQAHQVGGVSDHVHIACSVPPSLSISTVVQKLKGTSSRFVKHLDEELVLYWQEGYGVQTFSKRDLTRVVAYIQNQKLRHAQDQLWPHLEATSG
jgi:REP element-mobilizing transposase RayT